MHVGGIYKSVKEFCEAEGWFIIEARHTVKCGKIN